MNPALFPLLGTIFDKIFPDPSVAADAKLKTLELAQKGELAMNEAEARLALGQIDVNKVEAGGEDAYTRRWRPTIGYILAAALAFQYIVNPILMWAAVLWGSSIQPPQVGLDDNLWELMFGVLGLAGWRTLDKRRGKA